MPPILPTLASPPVSPARLIAAGGRGTHGCLRRHVEVRPQREAHPGYLPLRRPDQRREQRRRPVERHLGPRHRHRAERVRQPGKVRGRAEQPGDARRARRVRRPYRDPDPPEPLGHPALQFGVPFFQPPRLRLPLRKPVRRRGGQTLPPPRLLSQGRSVPQASGSAMTSHPNAPFQLPSSPSSSETPPYPSPFDPPAPLFPSCPSAVSSPSLIPASFSPRPKPSGKAGQFPFTKHPEPAPRPGSESSTSRPSANRRPARRPRRRPGQARPPPPAPTRRSQ